MTLQKDFQDRINQEKKDIEFYINTIEKAKDKEGSYRALSRALNKGEVYITNALTRKKISQLKKICENIIEKNIIE